MINSCKIFHIRYKMRGTKHPWVHEQEINKTSEIFLGRGVYTCFTSSRHKIKFKLTLGNLLHQRSRFMTSSFIFANISKNGFCSVKYTRVKWHGWWSHQATSLSKDHPWCKFQKKWQIIKPKILEGIIYAKNCAPSPVTHSLTYSLIHSLTESLIHSLSLTLDLGKWRKLFYSFITNLFTFFCLDEWLFLSLLFQ